ncbi:hypothetical protein D9M69_668310 [compost metagenome]
MQPSAGTTSQSVAPPVSASVCATGTVKPWAVRTRLRVPTMVTSKGATSSCSMAASSFAVVKTSSTMARPESNTPSRARTSSFMAITIPKMSKKPMVQRAGLA